MPTFVSIFDTDEKERIRRDSRPHKAHETHRQEAGAHFGTCRMDRRRENAFRDPVRSNRKGAMLRQGGRHDEEGLQVPRHTSP